MKTQEHTAGAVRAAEAIREKYVLSKINNYSLLDIDQTAELIDREVGLPLLLKALRLVDLHFHRNLVSEKFQGDDEHEAWTAVQAAIRSAKGETL